MTQAVATFTLLQAHSWTKALPPRSMSGWLASWPAVPLTWRRWGCRGRERQVAGGSRGVGHEKRRVGVGRVEEVAAVGADVEAQALCVGRTESAALLVGVGLLSLEGRVPGVVPDRQVDASDTHRGCAARRGGERGGVPSLHCLLRQLGNATRSSCTAKTHLVAGGWQLVVGWAPTP